MNDNSRIYAAVMVLLMSPVVLSQEIDGAIRDAGSATGAFGQEVMHEMGAVMDPLEGADDALNLDNDDVNDSMNSDDVHARDLVDGLMLEENLKGHSEDSSNGQAPDCESAERPVQAEAGVESGCRRGVVSVDEP